MVAINQDHRDFVTMLAKVAADIMALNANVIGGFAIEWWPVHCSYSCTLYSHMDGEKQAIRHMFNITQMTQLLEPEMYLQDIITDMARQLYGATEAK